MNIFELFTVICIFICRYLSGEYFGSKFGLYGWVGGSLLGAAFSIIIYYSIRKAVNLFYKWHPPFPKCKVCFSNNTYKPVEFTTQGIIFKCACGKRYIKEGDQFMELLDDDSKQPYMHKSPRNKTWVLIENQNTDNKKDRQG